MTHTQTYAPDQFYNKSIEKLRFIAQNHRTRLLRNPNQAAKKRRHIPVTEIQFLTRFITETAFYIEELERITEEEMNDYWETREHALHILTEHMIDHLNSDSSDKKD